MQPASAAALTFVGIIAAIFIATTAAVSILTGAQPVPFGGASTDAKKVASGYELAGGGVHVWFDARGRVTAWSSLGSVSMAFAESGSAPRTGARGGASLRAHGNRVTYSRPGIQQWLAAGPLGIEQGFTVDRRPVNDGGTLTLAADLRGTLRATLPHGQLLLKRSSGQVALRYGDLSAFDARGRRLPARIQLRGRRVMLRVADRGAVFPIRIDPLVESGVAPSDVTPGDTILTGTLPTGTIVTVTLPTDTLPTDTLPTDTTPTDTTTTGSSTDMTTTGSSTDMTTTGSSTDMTTTGSSIDTTATGTPPAGTLAGGTKPGDATPALTTVGGTTAGGPTASGNTPGVTPAFVILPSASLAISTTGSRLSVRVACKKGTSATGCAGRIVLDTRITSQGRRAVKAAARAASSRKTATVSVGTAAYSVAAGRHKTVRVTLNSKGRALLDHFYRLPARVRFTGSAVRSTSVTFRYGRVGSLVKYAWTYELKVSDGWTVAHTLAITGLPPRSTVQVLCNGDGCPFAHRDFAPRHSRLDLEPLFVHRRLDPKATVELRMLAANQVGKVVRFTVVAGSAPKLRELCLPPGISRPRACV